MMNKRGKMGKENCQRRNRFFAGSAYSKLGENKLGSTPGTHLKDCFRPKTRLKRGKGGTHCRHIPSPLREFDAGLLGLGAFVQIWQFEAGQGQNVGPLK